MGNGHIVAVMWCGCGDLQYTVVLGALYLPWCLGSVFTFFPYEEGVLLRKFSSKPIPKHLFWQSLENLWKSAFRGGDLKPGLCLHYLQKKAELRCLDWCWEDLSKAIISNPKGPLEPKPNISVLFSERTEWGSSLHLLSHPAITEMALTSRVSTCFTAPNRKKWAKPWHLPWVLLQHLPPQ